MYHTDLPPARDIIYKYTCISFKTVAFTIGTSVKDAAPVYMVNNVGNLNHIQCSYTMVQSLNFLTPFNNFNGHLLL